MSGQPPPTPSELSVGILVVSTTAAVDPATDRSSKLLAEFFDEASKTSGAATWKVKATRIVGDEMEDIQQMISHWADIEKFNLIVTTGGTGFAKTDTTPEAVKPLLEKEAPGLVHAMLSGSLAITPFAMMSRPIAGVRGSSVIVTVPGSPKGAKENLESIIKLLPHACIQSTGAVSSRKLHSPGLAALEEQHNVSGSRSRPHHDHEHSHNHSHSQGHSHSHCRSHGHDHGHAAPLRLTTPTQRLSATSITPVTLRPRHSPYPTLSLEAAKSIVNTSIHRCPILTLPLDPHLTGHVLAESIHAPESVPPFRASIVDGYALHHSDGPGVYPVVSISHAAPNTPLPTLQPGTITRITTGAPLPPGATAVCMVEDTVLREATADGTEELSVEILAQVPAGANIREPGSDIMANSLVLKAGSIFSATGAELAQLASVGVKTVRVFGKPIIGVMSTGNELVDYDVSGPLKHGQIRDTNRPALLTLFSSHGFPTLDLQITPDTPEGMSAALEDALRRCDILITTGGVSMGELDLLKPTLTSIGATVHFGRLAMKPGKPTTFATVHIDGQKKLVFALPGNPASAMTTALWFVIPAAKRAAGWDERAEWPKLRVKAGEEWGYGRDGRRELRRVLVSVGREGLVARQTGGQRSSRVGSMVGNGVVDLPGEEQREGRMGVKVGDEVEVTLWGELVMERLREHS